MTISEENKRKLKRGGIGLGSILLAVFLFWLIFWPSKPAPVTTDAHGNRLPTKADSVQISKKEYDSLKKEVRLQKQRCKDADDLSLELAEKNSWLRKIVKNDSVLAKNIYTHFDSVFAKFVDHHPTNLTHRSLSHSLIGVTVVTVM